MASPRLVGGSDVTSAPSIRMRPDVTSSSPAIRRSNVDLPQPDGPTKTTNSPSAISRLMSGIAANSPNALRTPSRVMLPMASSSFHGAKGEAAHQALLREPAEHQDRPDRERGRG